MGSSPGGATGGDSGEPGRSDGDGAGVLILASKALTMASSFTEMELICKSGR
jgi:hypothetical protein